MNAQTVMMVRDFCRLSGDQGATSLFIEVKDDEGILLDAGEFELKPWEGRLLDGVVEWLNGLLHLKFRQLDMKALKLTGKRHGPDKESEILSRAYIIDVG